MIGTPLLVTLSNGCTISYCSVFVVDVNRSLNLFIHNGFTKNKIFTTNINGKVTYNKYSSNTDLYMYDVPSNLYDFTGHRYSSHH